MTRVSSGRALAAIVVAVALLNTLSALSMPVPERRPGQPLVVAWLVLTLAHAALYAFGAAIRERWSLRAYAIAQGAVVFAIAASGAPPAVAIGLFMACTAELVVLAGARWGTVRITLGAIGLFVLAALVTSDLYRATTAGLLLAVTGMIAHAIAGLLHRPAAAATTTASPMPASDPPASEAPASYPPAQAGTNGAMRLSAREAAVLRELVSGARNSDIAVRLGISERTVKSHLGSIYQKLGVESRAGAVAAAVQRKLV